MADSEEQLRKSKYIIKVDFELPKKLHWYYAPVFAAFWLVLFLAVVGTQVNRLPPALSLSDEAQQSDAFIAERAEQVLMKLCSFGPKVTGSIANEVIALNILLEEVEKIQAQASDYYEFEVDVQLATGNYVMWSMINMYQAIQNVVVKVSAKGSLNENYLLVNSHFDSVPGSPGAGDDGAMVVVMLEVMRVITKTEAPLEHPIIFLFNGAEENPMQGSHAFIMQHKWANNCKALINLDACGNGGREILFQSGPKHGWLMNYYRMVPHPFANTLGEELFQAGYIPSDTDFRIFRDFGGVPGLDMAYIFNGYVYHTEFDRFGIVGRSTLQHTGDNLLSLTRSLANAPELDSTTLHSDEHVVFYDVLGWFMLYYKQTTNIIVNSVVCAAGLAAIGVSLFFMRARSGLWWHAILIRYAIALAIQLLALGVGAGLAFCVAAFMDGVDRSLSWFSENWLILGLYFCPMFFGMGIIPAVYLLKTRKDSLSLGFRIQLFMHAHCLFLVIITVVLTCLEIRSAYMFMLAIFFETAALIFNLVTTFHGKGYWFAIASTVCQILPFLFYTYVALATFYTLIPMQGRSGAGTNPELLIATLAVFTSLLFAGFIIPLFLFFRKTCTLFLVLGGITLVFIIVAVTPAGFPFKPKTAVERYSLIHAHRILHNPDNSTRIDETGVIIYPSDRRYHIIDEHIGNIGELHEASEYCVGEMNCGMPHYPFMSWRYAYWIPVAEYPIIPNEYPELTLVATSTLDTPTTKQFNFSVNGPDHMTLFIGPLAGNRVVSWSFNDTMLREQWRPPYLIYWSYGVDNSSLEFTIDVEKNNSISFDSPSLEIGIAGHWRHEDKQSTISYQKYVSQFPDYAYVVDWPATYESWIF